MKLPSGIIEAPRVVTSPLTGNWCLLSYPGHPKGCPNYGREGCPPRAPLIEKIMYLSKPVYIAYSEFDLRFHIETMRKKHPRWSERQLQNVLYWQNTSRKQMRQRAKLARYITGADLILTCPEAHGVNVYATCRQAGLRLQKIKHLSFCRHIALIGFSFK